MFRGWSVILVQDLAAVVVFFIKSRKLFSLKIMGVGECVQTPITKPFLELLLKKPITDFKVSGGSNPGDNFTSILISMEITLADKQDPIHLLYKTFPNHLTRQKFLEDTNLFLKEYKVYSIWIPELIKFQSALVGNGPEKILIPAIPQLVAGAAIDYEDENNALRGGADPILENFILMVDVRKTYGFKMADKLKSLGYHHVKVVLHELAKYHALSHAYKFHHKLPTIRSKFPFIEDPLFCNPKQRKTIELMMEGNLAMIRENLADYLAANPAVAKSLDKFTPERCTDTMQLFLNENGVDEENVENLMRMKPNKYSSQPLKDQWIVAGHGDCWTNNMLFKSDSTGRVTATTLVDLQIARESCIMADLIYFIYTSTDTQFREKHLAEMLAMYYQKFLDFCTILKTPPFPGFTLDNLERKFHRSKLCGFVFATLVLPIILQKPESSVNMDSLEQVDGENASEEFAVMLQKLGRDEDDNNRLKQRFLDLINELHSEGVL